jgi:hypothetical protein
MGKTDTSQIPVFGAPSPEYEVDFHAWLVEQGSRIRLLRIPGIDSENLAEEILSLGRSEKRELRSRLAVLLTHLLKWHIQPLQRSGSWQATIFEQRDAIEVVLSESPSLRQTISSIIADRFGSSVRQAALETGLPKTSFPPACPWTPAQVLSEDFLPEG